MAECVFCGDLLSNGSQVVTLTPKGCEGIAKTSAGVNDNIQVIPGQQVHTNCRRDYNRDGSRQKRKSPVDRCLSLRSSDLTFCYQDHCLFCGTGDRHQGRQKDHVLVPVRTFDFQDNIRKKCGDRADEWGETVLSRINFVQDLHAADAMYHQSCSVNFRTMKQIPECFRSDTHSSKKRKTGRPVAMDREQAFLKVVDNLEANDEELTTVQDLISQMADALQNSESEPYGHTHMREKLREHFGDKIVITEINGKKNSDISTEGCLNHQ